MHRQMHTYTPTRPTPPRHSEKNLIQGQGVAEEMGHSENKKRKMVLTQQQQCHRKQETSERGCSCDAFRNGCTWGRSEGSRDEQ